MSVNYLSEASVSLEELSRFLMLRPYMVDTPRHSRKAVFVSDVVIQSTRYPCGVL